EGRACGAPVGAKRPTPPNWRAENLPRCSNRCPQEELDRRAQSPAQSPHAVRRLHQVRSYGPLVQYVIRVKGHLGPRWTAWFDGLSLTTDDDGTTVICGPVVDQAALHGLLQKVRDIGVPLLSLTQVPPERPDPSIQR